VLIDDELILEMDEFGNSEQEQVPASVAALVHHWFVGSNPVTEELIAMKGKLEQALEKLEQLRSYKTTIDNLLADADVHLTKANNAIYDAKKQTRYSSNI